MAEHKLSILVEAIGAAKAAKNLKGVDATISKIGATAGKGLRTAGSNLGKMAAGAAVVGIGAVTVAVKQGMDTLVEWQSAQQQAAGAIKVLGLSSKISAGDVWKFANAYEDAVHYAASETDINAAAIRMLQFGKVSVGSYKRATAAAIDLGAAMKTGPAGGAVLLSKALADPAKAAGKLARAGVILTKKEQDRIKVLMKANKLNAAQAIILAAVEKRMKGAAAASQGPAARAMGAFNDAVESAQAALAEGFLPILTDVANALSSFVGDPKNMAMIRGFGTDLASSFKDVMTYLRGVNWGSISNALGMAAGAGKTILDTFLRMPDWVKGLLVGGFALDKLSGGAVSGIIGEIGKGLIKGVLGMNAGVVNINAGIVNGGGGAGGLLPSVAGAAGGGSILTVSLAAASVVAIGGAVLAGMYYVIPSLFPHSGSAQPISVNAGKPGGYNIPASSSTGYNSTSFFTGLMPSFTRLAGAAGNAAVQLDSLGRVVPDGTVANDPTGFRNSSGASSIAKTAGDTLTETIGVRKGVEGTAKQQADSLVAFRASERASTTGLGTVASTTRTGASAMVLAQNVGAARIASTIAANRPQITTTVNVSVTAARVQQSTTVQNRTGPGNGSHGGGSNDKGK